LISFWWDRVDEDGKAINADAGRKAFIVNRVGDFAVIIAMTMLFWTFGTLNYEPIFEQAVEFFVEGKVVTIGAATFSIDALVTIVTILFLLGVAGKSAQIPLYIWLPDAMAGPTPVSALIHAATMVTAGVFLIVRSNVLYELARISDVQLLGFSSPEIVAYTGAFTALVAALIAFTQWDIKKVLAYSTISQLGFMVAAAGMGAYVAAMFHLVAHAFFKALLFLGSGSVIHGMEHGHHEVAHVEHDDGAHHDDGFDPQDMRTMGGLRKRMPVTFIVYLIGALALAGIVPFAGFWSKDEILAHSQRHVLLIFIILVVAAFGTAFYVGRQLQLTFFGKPRSEAAEHAHESPRIITIPLIILAILTTLGGLMNLPFLTGDISESHHGHPEGIWLALEAWLEHSIASFEYTAEGIVQLPKTPVVISPSVAGLSSLLAIIGLAIAFFIYRRKPETAEDPDPLQKTPIWWFSILPLETFYMKTIVPGFKRFATWLAFPVEWEFWHDFVHDKLIRDVFVSFSTYLAYVIDAKGVDGIVNGAGKVTNRLSQAFGYFQTGYVRTYALGVFIGAVALIIYFLFIAAR
jgi:NADH-quinone oxidoreductase subunit L